MSNKTTQKDKDDYQEPQYDEWGVNVQYSKRPTGIDNEIEEANEYARYWYNMVGVNVIPCISTKKRAYLMKYADYYNKEMDEKTFKHLLDIGIFHNGIAALCGPIYRGKFKGKFFNLIDYDNAKGRDVVLTDVKGRIGSLEELAQKTIIETNKGSPNRGHVFCITERSMKTKTADNFDDEDKPRLEIYGENHVTLVANSYKYEKVDGEVPDYQKAIYKTEIMKSGADLQSGPFTRLPMYLDSEGVEMLEIGLDQKLAKYGVTYLNSSPNNSKDKSKKSRIAELTLDELLGKDFRVHKGGNKQGHLLIFIDKLLIYLKEKNIPISYEEVKQIAVNYNNTRFDAPVLKEKEVIQKVDDAIKFVDLKIGFVDGEKELIKELEDLGVKVEDFLYEKNLTEAAHDLWKLVKSHKLEHDKPIDTEDAANIIEEKYPKELKAFDDTEEILSFNGKCYEVNGERIVKKEIERLRREEQDTINRLGELEDELSDMIRRRYNAGKDTKELENYELALEERIAQENLSHMKVTDHFRKEVIKHIANRFPVNRDAFTTDVSTIVLDNGVLKLNITSTEDGTEDLTWKLIPHSPDILSLNLMPIKYDEKAECPMWKSFLNKVTGHNEKARRDVQKLFGYSLYKSLKFKKAFMLLGPHDSGKSIILGVLEHMIGLENVSSMTLQQICDGNQFATSALYGKMMNICGDLDKEKIRNMGRFKIFVGGDRLNIEAKNKPPISYLPTAKGVFSTNTIPDVEEDDAAYYIRWEIIPIEVSIPSEEQDLDLKDKIINNEMSGILNWSLQGLKMLLDDGKFEYSDLSGLDIENMYKESADLVYEFKNRYYKDVPIEIEQGKIVRSGIAVPCDEVHHTFLSFLKQDENRIAKFLDMRLYNGSGKGIGIKDLDDPVIKAVITQRLGSRLADLGIKSRQLRNERLGGERVNHYVGLKRDYGKAENLDKDSAPLEDAIEE